MAEKEDKRLFKNWLETLQQESWQLELLISGLALVGIFQAKPLLDDFQNFIDVQFFTSRVSFLLNLFFFILKGSWYIFIINLLIHIILRGLWIGAIGLRYVSDDINYEELNFSNYFEKLFRRRYNTFVDYIQDLERICSVMFAYTFLLFFIFISATMIVFWPALFTMVITKVLDSSGGPEGIVILLYILIGLFVLIDFIFLNPLKRIKDKNFSRIYGMIFRFYSTITLSFIFRPFLLNFIENKFTKKLFLFSIPYGIVIIFLLPRIESRTHTYFPDLGTSNLEQRASNSKAINSDLYDNLRSENNKKKINLISLESDVVRSNVLKLFLPMRQNDVRYLEDSLKIKGLEKIGFYMSFRNPKVENPELDSIIKIGSDKLVAIINQKSTNPELHKPQEWAKLKDDQILENEGILQKYYRNRLELITNAIVANSKFYIDGKEVSKNINFFFAEHENLNEKGWNGYLNLDSIPNGFHLLKLERGTYNRRNKLLSTFEMEIPFILDK